MKTKMRLMKSGMLKPFNLAQGNKIFVEGWKNVLDVKFYPPKVNLRLISFFQSS